MKAWRIPDRPYPWTHKTRSLKLRAITDLDKEPFQRIFSLANISGRFSLNFQHSPSVKDKERKSLEVEASKVIALQVKLKSRNESFNYLIVGSMTCCIHDSRYPPQWGHRVMQPKKHFRWRVVSKKHRQRGESKTRMNHTIGDRKLSLNCFKFPLRIIPRP